MVMQWQLQLLAVLYAGATLCDLLRQEQHQSYFNYKTNPDRVWTFAMRIHFVQGRVPSTLTHTAV